MPRRTAPSPAPSPALAPATPVQAGGSANTDGDRPGFDGPSKSQRKRDMHALQDLGERLVEIGPDKLQTLQLPDKLVDAVLLARRITAHEGRRRQMQYIGKLMRDVDAAAIRSRLDVDAQQHRAETAIMHAAERWRDALLDAPERLAEFVDRYPDAAQRNLHAMLRSAIAEVARAARGRHYRELYRELREIMVTSNA